MITIPTSDFDIRYSRRNKSDFLLILHEQYSSSKLDILSAKIFGRIQTSDSISYSIQIPSTLVDTIDFLLIKADDHTVIRLDDFSKLVNGCLTHLSNNDQIGVKSFFLPIRFERLKLMININQETKRKIKRVELVVIFSLSLAFELLLIKGFQLIFLLRVVCGTFTSFVCLFEYLKLMAILTYYD